MSKNRNSSIRIELCDEDTQVSECEEDFSSVDGTEVWRRVNAFLKQIDLISIGKSLEIFELTETATQRILQSNGVHYKIKLKCMNGIGSGGRSPLLTVIIRTTGTRNEQLERALISLLNQDFKNFEILLVLSSTSEKMYADFRTFVDALWFSSEVRLATVWCNAPGRVAPLNTGLLCAQGDYVTFLDDDDYALSNWLQNYSGAIASVDAPTVLRQQVACANSDIESPEMIVKEQERSLPQVKDFSFEYTQPWSFFKTLSGNFTPIMAMAVPRNLTDLDELIFFDSNIELAEDWDFLLANCMRYPLVDIPEIGAVYNKLEANSRNLDRASEWEYSFRYVRRKLDNGNALLHNGWLTDYLKSQQSDTHILGSKEIEVNNELLNQQLLFRIQELESLLSIKEDERELTEIERKKTEIQLRKLLRRSPLLMIRKNSLWRSLIKEGIYE